MFPQTDKVRKRAENGVDIFPQTDEGIRRTSCRIEPYRGLCEVVSY